MTYANIGPLIRQLRKERGMTQKALAALSAAILPYLYVLSILLGQPEVFRLGLPVAPAAMGYLWGVYGVVRRRRGWPAAGEILALSALLSAAVHLAVRRLAPGKSLWGEPLGFLLLSAACFLTDFVRRRMGEAWCGLDKVRLCNP